MFSKSKPATPEYTPQAPALERGPVVNRSNHTFSIIASDVEIVGNLSAKVDLHIDGYVKGDVICGSLVQGEGSVIEGKVIAQTAKLAGSVNGSIEAGNLSIEVTARIKGDVAYENLTIAPGGQVEGKFKHKSSVAPSISKTTVSIPKNDDALLLDDNAKVA